MNNAELIAALRRCGDEPYDITKPCKVSPWKLMRDAADALEAQQVDLRKANEIIAEGIRASRKSRAALETAQKLIAELEAQLPKEGEWIDDNGANVPLDRDGYTTGMCRCSVCNDWLIASDEYEVRGRYCPSCGSRMAKGEQE